MIRVECGRRREYRHKRTKNHPDLSAEPAVAEVRSSPQPFSAGPGGAVRGRAGAGMRAGDCPEDSLGMLLVTSIWLRPRLGPATRPEPGAARAAGPVGPVAAAAPRLPCRSRNEARAAGCCLGGDSGARPAPTTRLVPLERAVGACICGCVCVCGNTAATWTEVGPPIGAAWSMADSGFAAAAGSTASPLSAGGMPPPFSGTVSPLSTPVVAGAAAIEYPVVTYPVAATPSETATAAACEGSGSGRGWSVFVGSALGLVVNVPVVSSLAISARAGSAARHAVS